MKDDFDSLKTCRRGALESVNNAAVKSGHHGASPCRVIVSGHTVFRDTDGVDFENVAFRRELAVPPAREHQRSPFRREVEGTPSRFMEHHVEHAGAELALFGNLIGMAIAGLADHCHLLRVCGAAKHDHDDHFDENNHLRLRRTS